MTNSAFILLFIVSEYEIMRIAESKRQVYEKPRDQILNNAQFTGD